eukprot:2148811-Lingulodinium_polyedra.AAC.1
MAEALTPPRRTRQAGREPWAHARPVGRHHRRGAAFDPGSSAGASAAGEEPGQALAMGRGWEHVVAKVGWQASPPPLA